MSELKVSLIKSSHRHIYVTVVLAVSKSDRLNVQSQLTDSSMSCTFVDGSNVQYRAVEAACFSGAFFALRQIGDDRYAVSITSVSGFIEKNDIPIFAIAAMIGVASLAGHAEIVTQSLIEGWELLEPTELSP